VIQQNNIEFNPPAVGRAVKKATADEEEEEYHFQS